MENIQPHSQEEFTANRNHLLTENDRVKNSGLTLVRINEIMVKPELVQTMLSEQKQRMSKYLDSYSIML